MKKKQVIREHRYNALRYITARQAIAIEQEENRIRSTIMTSLKIKITSNTYLEVG